MVAWLGLLMVAAVNVDVHTLGGERVSGSLAELSAERVVVRAIEKERTVAAADLSHIEFPTAQDAAPAEPAAWIALVDGSQLLATEVSLARRSVSCKTPLDAALAIEQRHVRSIRLQAMNDAIDPRWKEIVARRATGDQIVVRRGERAVDSLEGIVRGVTAEEVSFEIDGEIQPVKRSRVFGLVFYQPAGRQAAKAACGVTDAAGNKLAAASLKLAGEELKIVTAAGLTFKRPLAKLARIDFAAANTVYLGDLKPESVEYTPLVGAATDELRALYQPRADRALFGGPLQLPRRDGQTYTPAWSYPKGLAIASRTRLVYRLPRAFRSFSAIAGIDSRLRPAGSVTLSIHGDDKQLFAGTITGKDEPRSLSLDLSGVRRLTVLVDFGDGLDLGDHLNLCEARLVE